MGRMLRLLTGPCYLLQFSLLDRRKTRFLHISLQLTTQASKLAYFFYLSDPTKKRLISPQILAPLRSDEIGQFKLRRFVPPKPSLAPRPLP